MSDRVEKNPTGWMSSMLQGQNPISFLLLDFCFHCIAETIITSDKKILSAVLVSCTFYLHEHFRKGGFLYVTKYDNNTTAIIMQ